MKRGMSAHEIPIEGQSDEWWTPPEVFISLGITFDLDPCSPIDGPVPWVPAKRFLTGRENGLTSSWHGRVWLNPPYGKQTGRWLARLADHGNGIALVMARTDTRWFQELAPLADILCFHRGRLTFIPGSGQTLTSNAGAPSVLLAYGSECAKAVERAALGLNVRPVPSGIQARLPLEAS